MPDCKCASSSTHSSHPSTVSASLTDASSVDISDTELDIGTALVVGGCGFLGNHIVRELLNEPTCVSIAVMSRSPFKNQYEGVEYYIGDITNIDHVRHVLAQVKPTVIFNTASLYAYIDHSSVPQTFKVNVDGNRNLLAVSAEIGNVKAYIYTSSAPIVSASGSTYDHADERFPTLAAPVLLNGDPYHIAKALGEQIVLEANRKHDIRTCTIRPTAMYGEGDGQMVNHTIKVLEDKQTNIFAGYNDIWMDVVYVGHVSRAQILAAKGLLQGIVDPKALKVDGEAFNVTDDEPAHPLDFFRKYWSFAGDATPLSAVWLIPPHITMFLAHIAEFCTWAISFGKDRPKMLKVERMEFVLLTRTYSIRKARDRLGFTPWHDQPYANQDDAVKGALDWYLLPENHGPLRKHGINPSWPEYPFRLICDTVSLRSTDIDKNHHCIANALIMAQTHNTIFRALNSIYYHAGLITPGTQAAIDLLSFCNITYGFMHHHQIMEETIYFPLIEAACKKYSHSHSRNSDKEPTSRMMQKNIDQHHAMESSLSAFGTYVSHTTSSTFSPTTLCSLISAFKDAYQTHQEDEISTILSLHNKIPSEVLKSIDLKMRHEAERQSDIFKAAPFVMGCQDVSYLLNGTNEHPFPTGNPVVPWIVKLFLYPRHADAWRFLPSDQFGRPKPLPKVEDFVVKEVCLNTAVIIYRRVLVGILLTLGFWFWFWLI